MINWISVCIKCGKEWVTWSEWWASDSPLCKECEVLAKELEALE